MTQAPSIFTRIIGGEIPCHKVYEDDQVIAFLDILPIQPGHTLVVPKTQVEFVWSLDDGLYHHLWSVVRRVAQRQQMVLAPHRVGVMVDGEAVPHAHVHVIPLVGADDMKAHRLTEPDHPALAAMAERLAFS